MTRPMVIILVLVFMLAIPTRAGRTTPDDASAHLNVNNNAHDSRPDDVATDHGSIMKQGVAVAPEQAGIKVLDDQKALFPFPISGGIGAGISANGRMGGFNIPGFGPVGRDVSGGMGMGGGMGIGGGAGLGNGAGVSGGSMSSGVGGLGGDSAGGFGTGAPVGSGGGPFAGLGDDIPSPLP